LTPAQFHRYINSDLCSLPFGLGEFLLNADGGHLIGKQVGLSASLGMTE
jgi:hypothetical protein